MNNKQNADAAARKTKIYYIISFIAVLIVAILFTFPLYWTITGAFKTGREINATVPFARQNYTKITWDCFQVSYLSLVVFLFCTSQRICSFLISELFYTSTIV